MYVILVDYFGEILYINTDGWLVNEVNITPLILPNNIVCIVTSHWNKLDGPEGISYKPVRLDKREVVKLRTYGQEELRKLYNMNKCVGDVAE